MGFIINPFMVAAAAVASTTKVQVRLAEFDEGDCSCSLGSTYEIWEDSSSSDPGAGDLDPAVGDWIAGVDVNYETQCAQVTALNSTADADGSTTTSYSDCSDCNYMEGICEGGGGPGGP
jgi:hypothetical protein